MKSKYYNGLLGSLTQHTKEEINSRGVYMILNHINNKVYIGSTCVSFHNRWIAHLGELKSNKHKNPYLQNSWNKYGHTQFEFKIIEPLDSKEEILSAEQYYLDVFFGVNCYNINPVANSTIGKVTKVRSRNIYLIDPEGNKHGPICNISDFARQHNLQITPLTQLIHGASNNHKGWQRWNDSDQVLSNRVKFKTARKARYSIIKDKRQKEREILSKKGIKFNPVGRPITDKALENRVLEIKLNNPTFSLRKIASMLDNKISYFTVRTILMKYKIKV